MADIKSAIEYAKQNPDTAFSTELRKRIESGSFNNELTQAGLTQYVTKSVPSTPAVSSYDIAIGKTNPDGTPNTDKGIIPQAVDQITSGGKQVFKGAANTSVVEGGKEIIAGSLNVAGGTLRGIFSPIEAALKGVSQLPGAKEALDAIKNHVVNPTSDVISNIPAVQKFVQANPNAESNIANAIAIAGTLVGGAKAPEIKTAVTDANAAINETLSKIKTDVPTPPTETLVKMVGEKVKTNMSDTPISIMNRVARLKPTDANKFKEMSGMTHGEYLTRTGNFGTPEQIITKEAQKFVDSLNSVDTALAKLPGKFQDGSISDALTGLVQKAKETSGENVKSPFLDEVMGLKQQYDAGGLTMEQINQVKRLHERNVKLGYDKLTNGTKVEQATNIDNALRKWQVNEAENLGFENLSELNKQTQMSRFIINKLGAQETGQAGLNAVTLTDWIMLSGGNPAAVAGLLVKKVFSSKAIQAKIAQMLADGVPVPTIEAKLGLSKVKQLPAPKEGSPQSQNFVPKEMGGKATVEAPAQQIRRQPILNDQKLLPAAGETSAKIEAGTIPLSEAGTIVKAFEKKFGTDEVKNAIKNRNTTKTMSQALSEKKANGLMTSKQAKPLQQERLLEKSSSKSTTSPKKVKGVIPETNLISEAKKYKSAEEFVKAQGTPVYHGTASKFDKFDKTKIGEATGSGDWGDGFYFSDSKDVARSFANDAGGDIVMEVNLKNLKFADGNKLEKLPEIQNILDDGMGFTDIGEYLKSKGYDGVKYKHAGDGGLEYVVYDADKIKTKSQLTDIWKKANKK